MGTQAVVIIIFVCQKLKTWGTTELMRLRVTLYVCFEWLGHSGNCLITLQLQLWYQRWSCISIKQLQSLVCTCSKWLTSHVFVWMWSSRAAHTRPSCRTPASCCLWPRSAAVGSGRSAGDLSAPCPETAWSCSWRCGWCGRGCRSFLWCWTRRLRKKNQLKTV